MSMSTCKFLRQEFRIILCLALLALPSLCNAAELKPEDVVVVNDDVTNMEANAKGETPVFGNIHGADELEVVRRLPELLRQHRVDAVICGVGH